MYNDSVTAVIHAVMYSSPFVCMTSRQIWSFKRAQFDLNTDPTNTHCCCEGGRKEKQMNEWEWMSKREIYWKRATPSSSLTLALPAIIEKKNSKEHSIRIQTASSSHSSRLTHPHTHTGISTHILPCEWTVSDSSLLGDSYPPPDPTRLHCPALHTQSQPTEVTWHAAVCVCCAVACSNHWGSDTRNTRFHFGQSQTLAGLSFSLKHPQPTSLCVNASACLPECLEYKLSPRHLP